MSVQSGFNPQGRAECSYPARRADAERGGAAQALARTAAAAALRAALAGLPASERQRGEALARRLEGRERADTGPRPESLRAVQARDPAAALVGPQARAACDALAARMREALSRSVDDAVAEGDAPIPACAWIVTPWYAGARVVATIAIPPVSLGRTRTTEPVTLSLSVYVGGDGTIVSQGSGRLNVVALALWSNAVHALGLTLDVFGARMFGSPLPA